MSTPEMTSALGLGTLILALIIVLVLLLRFLRSPENHHPMDSQPERNIEQIRHDTERWLNERQVGRNRPRI